MARRSRALATAFVWLLVLAALAAWAPTVQARKGTRPPALAQGNRGADVLALQHLLEAQGLQVDTDGVYGPQTTAAVRQVQRDAGLGTTGEVRDGTWSHLLARLEPGARGPAVEALQHQLIHKHGAELSVDGRFGPATGRAVDAFQAHASLSRDGVVGSGTWTRLLDHYSRLPAQSDVLCAYGDARSVDREMWGTASAVAQLRSAAEGYAARGGRGRVAVGDLSQEHGGDIPGHATHEQGLDVDIRPMRKDSRQCTEKTYASWAAYDRAATRRFVQEVHRRAEGRVKVIWFNDRQLIREGLVEPARGHDNHLHIRYCEVGHSDPDYRC